jgi:RNA polymerase sigma factor (sigma-70 family)
MDWTCNPERITALAQAGDPASLDALLRCQGERLLAVGRLRCRSEQEAEDAVQEAMISASQHLGALREAHRLEGWVVSMVARACSRMRRGQKNASHEALSKVEGLLAAAESGDPEAELRRAELAHHLGEALLSLQPEERMALYLAEAEGWKGPQIAQRLGISEVALRARLSRARRRVRERLQAISP